MTSLAVDPGCQVTTVISAAFNPTSLITGGGAFWRADMGVTTSSGNVTAWADQSSFGNNLANTGTVPFSSTSFNSSFPGITLPNGSTTVNLHLTPFTFNSTTGTAFALLQTSGTSSGNHWRYIALGNPGGNDFGPLELTTDQGTTNAQINLAFTSNSTIISNGGSTFSLTNNTTYLIGLVWDGAHSQLWVNGATQGSAVAFTAAIGDSTPANNEIYIGRTIGGDSSAGAIYAFVGWTQRAMNSTDWTNLKNFSNTNWGTSF